MIRSSGGPRLTLGQGALAGGRASGRWAQPQRAHPSRAPQATREGVKDSLQVHNETLCERYLGMPTDVGHSKNGTFKYLLDRVWEKIRGWMEKLLSSTGKEVLIKSVAQAIPVFSMSCFRLPRGVCLDIESLIRQFWWGSKRGKRKPSWVAWDVMIRPKYIGVWGSETSSCSTWRY